jgi:hypothetical protein
MYWLLFKYQRNFNVPLKQDAIYRRCLTWLKAPSGKLDKQDVHSDLNHLMLTALLKIKIDATEYVLHSEFKLTIECLEMQYRIIMEDFTFSYYDTDSLKTIKFKMESEDEWNVIQPYVEKISDNLFKYVSLPSKKTS